MDSKNDTYYRITPTTKAWLENLELNFGAEVRDQELKRFINIYDHYTKSLKAFPADKRRVKALHTLLDEVVAETIARYRKEQDLIIPCVKGCADCCKMFVSILPTEAKYIFHKIKAMGIEINWSRLERQRGKGVTDFFDLGEDKTCVFLAEDNSCKIYSFRPNSCRIYCVADTNEFCSMERKQKVKQVFMIEPEAALTAAFDVENEATINMADSLLRLRGSHENT